MYPYIVLFGAVAMLTGVPVKWVETRTEHFIGSTHAAGRVGKFELALNKDGTMVALRIKIVDDVGAYPRSPEPGHLLRQFGNLVGPYHIKHVAVDAKVVVTNTVPTSPIRGFGGQHLYFPLEKLVTKAAKELGLDPAEIRFRNFIQPNEIPYETPTGGIYDSGNYPATFRRLLELIDNEKTKEEIAKLKREGRLIGLGLAVTIDASVSNIGYLDVTFSPEKMGRAEFLQKSGGQHVAVVKMGPSGRIICQIDSNPQGQGHETTVAQVISSVLGVKPEDVTVITGIDTHRGMYTISSGTYSSRFGSVGISAVYSASMRLKEKILKVASRLLGVPPDQLEVGEGKVFVKSKPAQSVSLRRIAGAVYWNPTALDLGEDQGLIAISTFNIPTLRSPALNDKTNSSGTYGFVADAALVEALVEVDPETGLVKILKYVTVHYAGTIINPEIVRQQSVGSVNQAIEETLYQDLSYNEDGQPLATNFGDYYVNSVKEAIDVEVDHSIQSKSPFTLLGSKGVGESNNESAPATIVSAIEDALQQWNIEITELPITPEKLWRKIEASKG